eukprot:UN24274
MLAAALGGSVGGKSVGIRITGNQLNQLQQLLGSSDSGMDALTGSSNNDLSSLTSFGGSFGGSSGMNSSMSAREFQGSMKFMARVQELSNQDRVREGDIVELFTSRDYGMYTDNLVAKKAYKILNANLIDRNSLENILKNLYSDEKVYEYAKVEEKLKDKVTDSDELMDKP